VSPALMSRDLPNLADYRRLAGLAVPVVFVQVGLMVMGVVDTMIVGRVSPVALAGVAIGNVCVYALATLGMGMVTALDPLVSQAVGANDEPAIARAVQRGVVISIGLGLFSLLPMLPVRTVLGWTGQPPELIAAAVPYVLVQIPSMMAFFLLVAVRQSLQALGHLRPVVVTIIVSNLLNGVLAWAFVFGKFGLPPMGTFGAGLATTLSRWAMVAILLVLAWPYLRHRLAWRSDTLEWRPIANVIRLGVPIAIQYELEFGIFATVALLMGRLGPVPASAHQIAINIASLTFMVPLGVSAAGSVLVGRAVGAGDSLAARRAGVSALVVGAAFMTLSGCVLWLAPRLLARAYSPDPSVIALASTLIPIAGVFQVFDGLQVVSIGVLRGAGDTRAPLIVNVIGYWFFALPLSLWFGFHLGWGPRGLWWGLVVGLMIVAIVLVVRVRQQLWRSLARLMLDEGAHAAGK
jgi:multidrug resistance protein, MATE family